MSVPIITKEDLVRARQLIEELRVLEQASEISLRDEIVSAFETLVSDEGIEDEIRLTFLKYLEENVPSNEECLEMSNEDKAKIFDQLLVPLSSGPYTPISLIADYYKAGLVDERRVLEGVHSETTVSMEDWPIEMEQNGEWQLKMP